MAKSQPKDSPNLAGILPASLVEKLISLSEIVVVELNEQISVGSSDLAHKKQMRPLFFEVGSNLFSENSNDFPPCAIQKTGKENYKLGTLLHLGNGWRCRVVPFPKELQGINEGRIGSAIVFALTASQEVVSRASFAQVKYLWIGSKNSAAV